jgi:hypothetical protein
MSKPASTEPTVRRSVKNSSRWNSSFRGKPGRRNSLGEEMGEQQETVPLPKGKDPLKVNGIPDWENPMESKATSVPESPSPKKNASQHRMSRGSPTRTNSVHLGRSERQVSSSGGKTALEASTYHVSTPNFENMVIECESDDSSCGDITYDESVANDEEFQRAQYNFQVNNNASRANRSHLQNYNRTPSRMPRRNATAIRISPPTCTQFISSEGRVHDGPPPDASVEDEERRLIELAMERSLQDSASSHLGSNSNASLMSMSRQSVQSEASYRSRQSNNSYRSRPSDLGSAGCHLTMLSGRTTSPRGEPPGEGGPGFIWKREGKKWMKIPVDSPGADGLHAIREMDESFMNESMNFGDERHGYSSRRETDPRSDDVLEQMEKEMLEEAMQRSMSLANYSPIKSGGALGISDGSPLQNVSIDPEAALARLRALEEEKAILQAVLTRSSSDDHSSHCGRISSSGSSRRSHGFARTNSTDTMRSSDSDLSGAGCHLAMVGARRYHQDNSNGTGRSRVMTRTRSSDSIDSNGQKLVWRRGPNNAWGRFPEDADYGDQPIQHDDDDEESLVAEALARSMREM